MKDSDWEKLIEGAGIIGKSNLIIDDTPGISVSELRSKCRKYKLEHDIQLIIIDYLQLMTGSVGRHSESQAAGDIRYFSFSEGAGERIECACSGAVSAEPCGGVKTR